METTRITMKYFIPLISSVLLLACANNGSNNTTSDLSSPSASSLLECDFNLRFDNGNILFDNRPGFTYTISVNDVPRPPFTQNSFDLSSLISDPGTHKVSVMAKKDNQVLLSCPIDVIKVGSISTIVFDNQNGTIQVTPVPFANRYELMSNGTLVDSKTGPSTLGSVTFDVSSKTGLNEYEILVKNTSAYAINPSPYTFSLFQGLTITFAGTTLSYGPKISSLNYFLIINDERFPISNDVNLTEFSTQFNVNELKVQVVAESKTNLSPLYGGFSNTLSIQKHLELSGFSYDNQLLSWSPLSSANRYDIYRLVDGQAQFVESVTTLTNPSTSLTSLSGGYHDLLIYPINDNHLNSTGKNIRLVKNLNLSLVNDSFTWQSHLGLSYRLRVGQTTTIPLGQVSRVAIVDIPNYETIFSGSSVSVRVEAFIDGITMDFPFSNTLSVALINRPNGLAYNPNLDQLNWTPALFASSYQVLVKNMVSGVENTISVSSPNISLAEYPLGYYQVTIQSLSTITNTVGLTTPPIYLIKGSEISFNNDQLSWPGFAGFQYELTINETVIPLATNTYNLDNSNQLKSGTNTIRVSYIALDPAKTLLYGQSKEFNLSQMGETTTFTYNRVANTVQWTPVENANGYLINIRNEADQDLVLAQEVLGTTFDLSRFTNPRLLKFSIRPILTTGNFYTPKSIDSLILVNFEFAQEDAFLNWSNVEGVSYELSINQTVEYTGSANQFTINTASLNAGNHTVNLKVSLGNSPVTLGAPQSLSFSKLSPVQSIDYAEEVFTWQPVSNATSYDIYLNQVYIRNQSERTFTLPPNYQGLITLTVVANNENNQVIASNNFLVELVVRMDLTYESGLLSWSPIAGMSYKVYVDNQLLMDVGNQAYLDLNSINLNPGSRAFYVEVYRSSSALNLLNNRSNPLTLTKLASINSIQEVNGQLVWSAINNATEYEIYIDDVFFAITQINQYALNDLPSGEKSIQIKIVASDDAISSNLSSKFYYYKGFQIQYEENVFTWNPLTEFQYKIILNTTGSNATIDLSNATIYDLSTAQLTAGLLNVQVELYRTDRQYVYAKSNLIAVTVLNPIQNLTKVDDVLTWTTNSDATSGYEVTIYRNQVMIHQDITLNNQFVLTSHIAQLGYYQFQLLSLSTQENVFNLNGAHSLYSLEQFTLAYSKPNLSFNLPNISHLSYSVYLNNQLKNSVLATTNALDLQTLTGITVGNNEVYLRAVSNQVTLINNQTNTLTIKKLAQVSNLSFSNSQFQWTYALTNTTFKGTLNGVTFETTNTNQADPLINGVNELTIRATQSGLTLDSELSTLTQTLSALATPSIRLDRTNWSFNNWDLFTMQIQGVSNADLYVVSVKIFHKTNASLDIVETDIQVTSVTNLFVHTQAYGKNNSGTPSYDRIEISIQSKKSGNSTFLPSSIKTVAYTFVASDFFITL